MTIYFAFRLSKIPQRGRRRKAKSIHLRLGLYSNSTQYSDYQSLGLCNRCFSILPEPFGLETCRQSHVEGLLEWFIIDGILSRSMILSERGSASMKKTCSSVFSVPRAKRAVNPSSLTYSYGNLGAPVKPVVKGNN